MAAGIGAVFQKTGAPSLRDLYSQDQQEARFQQKLEASQAAAKQKEDAKNTFFLNKALDPSKFGTGNPQGPEITAYLIDKRNEYAKMQKETGMSTAEMMGLINQDIASVQGYLQQSKMFDATIKKVSSEMEKMGYKGSEIDREVRKRIFFDGDKPRPFDQIEWDVEGAIDDIRKNGIDNLTINSAIPAKRLQSRQLSTEGAEVYVSNTPNAGTITKTRNKGTAYFDPLIDEVKKDQNGVVTGIFTKSAPFTNQDGSAYINPETKQPADDVVTDDVMEYLLEDKATEDLFNKGVSKRVKALKEKGVEVTDRDIEYLRKDEATEFVYNNKKSKFSSSTGNTTSWRRAERPRAASGSGSTKKIDGVNFEIAPRTQDGGFDITGQTGPMSLGKDPATGRTIYTDKIISYPDGSAKLIYTNRDRFGNAVGDPEIKYLSSDEATNFVNGNRNLPGNRNTSARVSDALKRTPANENFTPGGQTLENVTGFDPKKFQAKPGAAKPASTPAPKHDKKDEERWRELNIKATVTTGLTNKEGAEYESLSKKLGKPVDKNWAKETPAAPKPAEGAVNKKTGKKKTLKINYN